MMQDLDMSIPFHEYYYATSPKPPFAQTDRKNHLLTIFITWIDAYSKYLSTGFIFVRFELEIQLEGVEFFLN